MGGLRDVELLEDEAAATALPRGRRRWWWVAGAVVVVGALVLAGQVVLDRRHREHEARFDDVPGVLLPVPRRPQVVWAVDDDARRSLANSVEVGGVLVGGTLGEAGYSISGTDRATGRARWTVTGPLGDPSEAATWVTDDYTPTAQCVPMGMLVACGVDEVGPLYIADAPRPTRILVLDPVDGTVLSDMVSTIRTWTADDGKVVTATSTPVGQQVTWTLTAHDPQGRRTWTRALPAVHFFQNPDGSPAYGSRLSADDGLVALAAEGHLWLLDRGGAVTLSLRTQDRRFYGLDRGVVVSFPYANEDGSPSSEPAGFVTRDGRWNPLAGTPLQIGVDDGSADDVMLSAQRTGEPTSQGPLEAHDATTGDLLWSHPAAAVDSALVLDETVYALVLTRPDGDTQAVVALDARTGRERWTSEAVRGIGLVGNLQLATDGRTIYLLGPAVVGALALDDGRPAPSVDLAPLGPVNHVFAGDGLLRVVLDVGNKPDSGDGVLG